MKFKQLLLTLGIITAGFVPTEAIASSVVSSNTYTFNRYIGSAYIGKVKGSRVKDRNRANYTDTKISTTFTLPTCGSRYYLSGPIQVKYTSSTGRSTGWKTVSQQYRGRNQEGQTVTRTVRSSSGLKSKGGTVSVKTNLTCKSLAPLKNNVTDDLGKTRDRVNDWLKDNDPTKGVFW